MGALVQINRQLRQLSAQFFYENDKKKTAEHHRGQFDCHQLGDAGGACLHCNH